MTDELWVWNRVVPLEAWQHDPFYRASIRREIRDTAPAKLRRAGAPRQRPVISIQVEPNFFGGLNVIRFRLMVGRDAVRTHQGWRQTRRRGW